VSNQQRKSKRYLYVVRHWLCKHPFFSALLFSVSFNSLLHVSGSWPRGTKCELVSHKKQVMSTSQVVKGKTWVSSTSIILLIKYYGRNQSQTKLIIASAQAFFYIPQIRTFLFPFPYKLYFVNNLIKILEICSLRAILAPVIQNCLSQFYK